MEILTVGDLARHISLLLRAEPALSSVWIRGEIANLSRSPAGHYYFHLRDDVSQIKCVLFRGAAARMGRLPQRGDAVVLHGSVAFYEAAGVCEICVDLLYPEGVGLVQLELEALKLKLETEGLFAIERKRLLPAFPNRVGLVTSDAGAVLHDMLQVLGRRYPLAEVVLASTSVQGERAPTEICAALQRLIQVHQDGLAIDVIVVARGGGAEHELAAFNDERVARTVFASPIPVVSAVGHETNVTIIDYVADLRAPTPSAAAELIAPDRATLRVMVVDYAQRAREAAERSVASARLDLRVAEERLSSRSPLGELRNRRASLKEGLRRARVSLERDMRLARERIDGHLLLVEALNPIRTIARGYAICTLPDGTVLRSVQQAEPGHMVDITLADGRVETRVTRRRPGRGLVKAKQAIGGRDGSVDDI